MEKTYTISQISKLLGLTNDAIRFYEKKAWFILLLIPIIVIVCIL